MKLSGTLLIITLLLSCSSNEREKNKQFYANVAQSVITPTEGTFMVEPDGKLSTGTHDELYVKVIALVYARGESFRTESLIKTIRQGLTDIRLIADEIEKYDEHYPIGQWDWKNDGKMALNYYNKIAVEGWPEYGGVVFQKIE